MRDELARARVIAAAKRLVDATARGDSAGDGLAADRAMRVMAETVNDWQHTADCVRTFRATAGENG